MPDRRHVLTPDALAMMDAIARTGSFAAAARELGKVPSALTYNVRQLEEALDVLLFDRSSRQAQPTAAGLELLHEGRRLLQELEAVANRVKRVASGWEATLSISVEDILSTATVFDLVEAFCSLRPEPGATQGLATRLRLRSDVLAGTWEALISGQVDLAIGVAAEHPNPGGVEVRPLGEVPFVFCVAPHHPLAERGRTLSSLPAPPLEHDQLIAHRAVAVADTAQKLATSCPDKTCSPCPPCAPNWKRCCAAWAAAICRSRWPGLGWRPESWCGCRPSRANRWRSCTTPGAPSVAPDRWAEPCNGG